MTNIEALSYLHKIDVYDCASSSLLSLATTLRLMLEYLNDDRFRSLIYELEEDLTSLYICKQYAEMENIDELVLKIQHIINLGEQLVTLCRRYLEGKLSRSYLIDKIIKLVTLSITVRNEIISKTEQMRTILPGLY